MKPKYVVAGVVVVILVVALVVWLSSRSSSSGGLLSSGDGLGTQAQQQVTQVGTAATGFGAAIAGLWS